MAGSIAKAYVQIIPSAEGIKGKLSDVFNGEMPSAGQNAGGIFGSNLVSKIKGLIAAAGIGKAFTDALMSGSDLEQLKGGVQKIFDEMDTATIMADAANAYKDLNMSANQYLATINDVGAAFSATMGDEKGYSVARTGLQAISDYATGTGKNVDELSQKFTMITRSTSSYQSIADQFSGILPATSAGFLEQAQAAGFLSDQYKSLTEVPIEEYQQAVSEMLAKGTAELGLAGNTAAETATTFAGSLAAMKSAYSNFLGALATGEDIGPSLEVLGETVFTFISGNLMPMVGNILAELPTVLSTAFSAAIRGLNIAADNADALLQQGLDLVTSIGSAIITALPGLADAAMRIVDEIGNGLSERMPELSGFFENLETVVIAATAALVGYKVAISISTIIDTVSKAVSALISATEGQTIAQTILNAVMNANPFVLVATLAAGLVAAIVTLWNTNDAFRAAVTSAWENIKNTVSVVVDALVTFFTSTVPNAVGSLLDKVASIPQEIMNFFTSVSWGEIGSNIVSGIANGIAAGAGAIWQAAKNAASAALRAAKDFLGIASPSKVMRDQVGKFIPSGMAVGIENNTKPLTDAMHSLSDLTTDTVAADLHFDNAAVSPVVPGYSYGDNNVTINVYAAENQDVDELAEILMNKIQFAISRREVSFAR